MVICCVTVCVCGVTYVAVDREQRMRRPTQHLGLPKGYVKYVFIIKQ